MSDERYDAILDALRDEEIPGPSEEIQQRLVGRLSVTVASSAAGSGVSEIANEVISEMASSAVTTSVVSTKIAMLMTAAGVAAGAAGGALTYHAVATSEPAAIVDASVAVVAPVEIDAAVDAPVDVLDAGEDADVPEETEAVDTVDTETVDTEAETDLAPAPSRRRERVLIRQAQNALARGRAADAIHALTRHRRRFADSAFAEERDALEVQALAADGQREAALRKANAFRARYPSSVFMPRVQAATR